MTANYINIALFGPVSAGKTTLLNALFVEQYADTKIKRTTMMPQVYHESDDKYMDPSKIKNINNESDKKYIESTESGAQLTLEQIYELEYYVPKIDNFVDLEKDVYFTVYDIPGLNDCRTEKIYFQYLNENFHKFDIVLLVIDINSSFNVTDEVNILRLIIENIKKVNYTYNKFVHLIIVLNKCDNMFIDEKTGDIKLEPEFEEMFLQASNMVQTNLKELFPAYKNWHIQPMAAEDAYIYRMYKKNPNVNLDIKHMNKFGNYEFGKSKWNTMKEKEKKKAISDILRSGDYDSRMILCGFKQFSATFTKLLTKTNQFLFVANKMRYNISQHISKPYVNNDITSILRAILEEMKKIDNLCTKFKIKNNFLSIYDTIKPFYAKYITEIEAINATSFQISNFEQTSVYMNIKKSLSIVKNNFKSLYNDGQDEYTNKITNNVISYVCTEIIKPTMTLKQIADCVDMLKTNNYNDVFQLFNRAHCTNNAIRSMNHDDLVTYVRDTISKYDFGTDQTIQFIYSVLVNVYRSEGLYLVRGESMHCMIQRYLIAERIFGRYDSKKYEVEINKLLFCVRGCLALKTNQLLSQTGFPVTFDELSLLDSIKEEQLKLENLLMVLLADE